MPQINELTSTDSVGSGDLVPVWVTNNGDTRKASVSVLRTQILDDFINALGTTITTMDSTDLFAVYDTSASNTVKITADDVKDYVRDNIFTDMADGSTITDDDLFMILESSSGATQAVTGSELITYLSGDIRAKATTQYASPSATGFNVQITDGSADIHLILTPTTNFAAGTITLPAVANLVDKQVVTVNCTQQVGGLTIDGNGAVAVTGEPTALGADDYFTLKYDSNASVWYRIA